jgi:hypothetical protein
LALTKLLVTPLPRAVLLKKLLPVTKRVMLVLVMKPTLMLDRHNP